MTTHFASLNGALMGGLLIIGCQSAPPVARQERPTYTVTLAPGMIDEICLDLAKDDLLHYRYRSTGPVDFNVHYHEGADVKYPVRKDGAQRVDGSFIPEFKQTYCLMWKNSGRDPVEIEYEFEHLPKP